MPAAGEGFYPAPRIVAPAAAPSPAGTAWDQEGARLLTAPTVSAIIVGYNGASLLPRCFQSLLDLEYPKDRLEVLYIDNASSDASVAVAAEWLRRFPVSRLLTNPGNVGYGAAINIAAKSAKGDLLLFLNQDLVLDREALSQAVSVFEERADVAVVGFRVALGASGQLYAAAVKLLPGMFCWNYRDLEGPCDVVSGSSFVIRAPVFRDVGGFDDAYFMYYDETDLCHRLARLGYTIWYCPRARATHFAESSRQRKSPFVVYHMLRNRSLMAVGQSSLPRLAAFADLFVYYPVDLYLHVNSVAQSREGVRAAFRARRDSLRRIITSVRASEPGGSGASLRHFVERTLRRTLRSVWFAISGVGALGPARMANGGSPPAKALEWVRGQESPTGGVRANSARLDPYPEVTGYLIPTLLAYGEREAAVRHTRWLIRVQRPDGAFASTRGIPHVFDTGQALRGLLAGMGLVPEAREAARKAAAWLHAQMDDEGRGGFGDRGLGGFLLQQVVEGVKGGFSPESYLGYEPAAMQLYVLPPLLQAADAFGLPEYRAAANRALEFYVAHKDALRVGDLTHYLAYELEALIDLGRQDLALPTLKALRRQQRADGSVRGQGGEPWVCSPGLAQLALCWYKVGQWEPADRALAWLEARQRATGGFLGSYGAGATYFPEVELPWAAKFYLDANLRRVRAFFERNERLFPASIPRNDAKVQALLSLVRAGQRVLDVGAGKGRISRALAATRSDVECVALDLVPAFLAHASGPVRPVAGAMEALPCRDAAFDVVFASESIEHSPNPEAALAEMLRAVKPGGWVAVIDKQRSHWGEASTPPWEQWPDASELLRAMARDCVEVSCEPVAADTSQETEETLLVWRGRKRESAERVEVLVPKA